MLYSIRSTVLNSNIRFKLEIRDIDPATFSCHYPKAWYQLFDNSRPLPLGSGKFNFWITEMKTTDPFLVVIGNDPSAHENFIYISLIFQNGQILNKSVPANQISYSWKPTTSLFTDNFAMVINCVSIIRILRLEDRIIKQFQYDLDEFLGQKLGQNLKNLFHYETDVILKEKSSVIILLSFFFYDEICEKWRIVNSLLRLSIEKKSMGEVQKLSKAFDKRPNDSSISEELAKAKLFIESLTRSDETYSFSLLSNQKSETDSYGRRLIRTPFSNIFIADSRDSEYEFKEIQ